MQRSKKFFVAAMVAMIGSAGMVMSGPVFAQSVSSSAAAATATTTTATATTVATMSATAAIPSSSNPNAGVAAAVQSYFADIPVMIAIAKCESGPRQFAANGSPLYAGTDDLMVGVFQIDSAIHTAPALALGFDITTLAGNLGYARYLYGAEGTEPWISSFPCWGSVATTVSGTVSASGASASATSTTAPTSSTTPDSASTPALTLNLSLGSIDPQVLVLQQLLNKAGFTLATSGPGSPGNETTKFAALTYAALKQFQCAQGIACSGDEATTGYGLLNAPTRAALLAVTSASVASSGSSSSTDLMATSVAAIATTTTVTVTSASSANDPAEIAELQSRVAALVVIVTQLEAELAARLGQ